MKTKKSWFIYLLLVLVSVIFSLMFISFSFASDDVNNKTDLSDVDEADNSDNYSSVAHKSIALSSFGAYANIVEFYDDSNSVINTLEFDYNEEDDIYLSYNNKLQMTSPWCTVFNDDIDIRIVKEVEGFYQDIKVVHARITDNNSNYILKEAKIDFQGQFCDILDNFEYPIIYTNVTSFSITPTKVLLFEEGKLAKDLPAGCSWDSASNTLTMNNATIDGYNSIHFIMNSANSVAHINVVGQNSFVSQNIWSATCAFYSLESFIIGSYVLDEYNLVSSSDLEITGSGTLNLSKNEMHDFLCLGYWYSGHNDGIRSRRLTIKETNLSINCPDWDWNSDENYKTTVNSHGIYAYGKVQICDGANLYVKSSIASRNAAGIRLDGDGSGERAIIDIYGLGTYVEVLVPGVWAPDPNIGQGGHDILGIYSVVDVNIHDYADVKVTVGPINNFEWYMKTRAQTGYDTASWNSIGIMGRASTLINSGANVFIDVGQAAVNFGLEVIFPSVDNFCLGPDFNLSIKCGDSYWLNDETLPPEQRLPEFLRYREVSYYATNSAPTSKLSFDEDSFDTYVFENCTPNKQTIKQDGTYFLGSANRDLPLHISQGNYVIKKEIAVPQSQSDWGYVTPQVLSIAKNSVYFVDDNVLTIVDPTKVYTRDINAIANEGYNFASWEIDGISEDNTIVDQTTISANFSEIPNHDPEPSDVTDSNITSAVNTGDYFGMYCLVLFFIICSLVLSLGRLSKT